MAADANEFSRQLGAFSKRVADLAKPQKVPLTELMSPDFMRAHTSVGTFEELIAATGASVETAEDFLALPDNLWERTVKAHTSFESWLDMQQVAGAEWMKRRLSGQ